MIHPRSATYRLQLDTNKSEMLWCTTARRQHHLPRCPFRSGPDTIIPSTAVWDLGIYIDSDLSMQMHVQRSVAGCFAALLQLRSIRRPVTSSLYQSLLVALVLSRLDYGNATLTGLPTCLLNRSWSWKHFFSEIIMNIWNKLDEVSCESVPFINSLKNKLTELYTDESFPGLHVSAWLRRPSHVSWEGPQLVTAVS